MHKQQASLFVAYKGQLFTNHCQKKNQNNQHSVHIKSALIINFTQSRIQVMLSMIKPSFMIPVLCFFLFKISSASIQHMLKASKEKKKGHMNFILLEALKGRSDLSSKNMSK